MKTINFIDPLFILISCLLFVVLNYFGALEQLSKFAYLVLVIGYYLGKSITYLAKRFDFKKAKSC